MGRGWPSLAGLRNVSRSRSAPPQCEARVRTVVNRVPDETISHAVIASLPVGPMRVLVGTAMTLIDRYVLRTAPREARATMQIAPPVESLPPEIAMIGDETIAPHAVSRPGGIPLRVAEIPSETPMSNLHALIAEIAANAQLAGMRPVVVATPMTHRAASVVIVNQAVVTRAVERAVDAMSAPRRAIVENAPMCETKPRARIGHPGKRRVARNRVGPRIAAAAARSPSPMRKMIRIVRVEKSWRSKCPPGSMRSRCLSAVSRSQETGAHPAPARAAMTGVAAEDVGGVARATASGGLRISAPRRFGDRRGRRC